MKKQIFIAAAAALFLSFTACQKDENIVSNDTPLISDSNIRVKTTSDLNNTDWSSTMMYSEFLFNMLGIDTTCMQGMDDDTLTFGLNFDGTFAHFSFPDNIEAYGGDEGQLTRIYGVSYAYSYNGNTHIGYLDGVADDEDGNSTPTQLQFTYDDATDTITIVLPMAYAEDGTPVNITLVFHRNE
ncbi:MAG: hypothetical protein IJU81_09045 [Bacteroidales bacterium]|nr:hypothetical protein [Bacteroidales bacterium]